MSRLSSRKELIDELNKERHMDHSRMTSADCNHLNNLLDLAFNELSSERLQGAWIEHPDWVFKYACNICGTGNTTNSTYCPWCGAIMRGEE